MTRVEPGFWRGRRVLLTGHTGFKGGWLALWLHHMGAEVTGYALVPPSNPALFEEAGVAGRIARSVLGDVRDRALLGEVVREARPEVVLHLAAQALVRPSYREPVETWGSNVMGTVHVLDALRAVPGVRAAVMVTTDKVYADREQIWGYRERDRLGGHDPYASSKAAAELAVDAWRRSFLREAGVPVATARAGNVIGGGDWAEDRLVPDCLAAFLDGRPVHIRRPDATRPWQHVLEPLSAYLVLAQRLWTDGHAVAEAWNFGPSEADARPVGWLAGRIAELWGPDARLELADVAAGPHEARWLSLDTRKAALRLGVEPRWDVDEALRRTVEWTRGWAAGDAAAALCLAQIDAFEQA